MANKSSKLPIEAVGRAIMPDHVSTHQYHHANMAPGLNRGVRICLYHTHRSPKIHPSCGRGGHWAPTAVVSYFSNPLLCASFLVVWSGLALSFLLGCFLLDGSG
ncbi:unnamed protein product [Pylaiella littoralis]